MGGLFYHLHINMSLPVLAYWDIRGLAQPIRLLLAYTETKYEDKYYVCGPLQPSTKPAGLISNPHWVLISQTCRIMLTEMSKSPRAMPSFVTLAGKIIFWEQMRRREFV